MGETLTLLCDRVDDTGGVERYWATVLPALLARGIDVQLIARTVGDRQHFGAPAIEVPWAREDERPSESAAERVRTLLQRGDAGTVVTAGVFDHHVLHAVRATARRWVVRIHDHRAFCPHGDRVFPQFDGVCSQPMGAGCAMNALVRGCMHGPHPASLVRLADRLAVRDEIVHADAVLVSTTHMRDTVAQNGVPRERIHLTPPPLADAAFCRRPSEPPWRPTLLFAGRLERAKGLQSLIRALSRIKRSLRPLLVVAGRGADEEARARALAGELDVETQWAGWLSQDALRAAIDGSTAICVPSLWPEPFGLVGSEALARGRPAVAYDVGGIRDWLGAAGISVARGDEAALAEAIVTITEPIGWPLRSQRALRHAERYRLSEHIRAVSALLHPPVTNRR